MNLWKNFCIEDFAKYWNLAYANSHNIYFQEINLSSFTDKEVFPKKLDLISCIADSISEDNKKGDPRTNYKIHGYVAFGNALVWLGAYLVSV